MGCRRSRARSAVVTMTAPPPSVIAQQSSLCSGSATIREVSDVLDRERVAVDRLRVVGANSLTPTAMSASCSGSCRTRACGVARPCAYDDSAFAVRRLVLRAGDRAPAERRAQPATHPGQQVAAVGHAGSSRRARLGWRTRRGASGTRTPSRRWTCRRSSADRGPGTRSSPGDRPGHAGDPCLGAAEAVDLLLADTRVHQGPLHRLRLVRGCVRCGARGPSDRPIPAMTGVRSGRDMQSPGWSRTGQVRRGRAGSASGSFRRRSGAARRAPATRWGSSAWTGVRRRGSCTAPRVPATRRRAPT